MMKKIAAALLLTSAFAAPAFADGNGFYAGVTLGQAKTNQIFANYAMTKSTDTVYGGLVGYQFNKNLGVEAQFTGTGKFNASSIPAGTTLSGKGDGFSVTAVGTLPLNDSFDLYGKVGIASVKTKLSSVPVGFNTGASRSTATFGLGVQYNVTPAIGIRAGWDRYGAAVANNAGAKSNFNQDVYSVGAVFKF